MIFSRPLPFVEAFVTEIHQGLRTRYGRCTGLSSTQRYWLSFCLMGVFMTNSICWERFSRAGIGGYKAAALSWMFRHSKIPWEHLLEISIRILLQAHGILHGVLVLDDSEKQRSKVTRRITCHKVKDKKSGGYFNGQEIIFLLLVTESITFPVGFAFYRPDPDKSAWRKQDKILKRKGITKKNRPQEPPRSPGFPTKWELALRLLNQFRENQYQVNIKCILADALYGNADFVNLASSIFNGIQVITQLRNNQNIRSRGRKLSLKKYFNRSLGVTRDIQIRGGKEIPIIINSARLFVYAQGVKRFVIAIKYADEKEYRYLMASDLSWRTEDIVRAYSLRWLIEVFFEDWKGCEGWDALTKQQGDEGSEHSLILSLLIDHCLLMQPDQLANLKHKRPAYTVGSMTNRIRLEGLLTVCQDLAASPDPQQLLKQITEAFHELFQLNPSEKHMVGRDLGRMEPTPSLKYRALQI